MSERGCHYFPAFGTSLGRRARRGGAAVRAGVVVCFAGGQNKREYRGERDTPDK